MGIIIRQSFKASTAMYFGAAIGVFNRLYLLPKYLSPEQIGLVDLLLIVSLFFSSISSLGVIGSLVKFYYKYKEQNRLPSFLFFLLLISLIGFSSLSFVLIQCKGFLISIFKNDTDLLHDFYFYIIPLTFAFILKGFFSNFSITNQRATVPAIIGDIGLKFGFTLLLLVLGMQFIGFSSLVFLLVLIYLLMNFILVGYCVKQFKFRISFDPSSFNKTEKKEIYTYSAFVLISGMSGYISQFIDTAMVGALQGLEFSGIYSIAFFLGIAIEMPKRAISSISLPIIVKHFDNKEYKQINKLYKQSSINQAIVGGLFLILIYVCIDEIFYLIPNSEKYQIGKNVALIIGLSRWIDMVTGVNSEILRSSKYYLWDLITILVFIAISITTNYILIPIYGINGAALASLISIIFYNLVRIIALYKLYQFNPFSIKTIYLIALLAVLVFLHFLIPIPKAISIFDAMLYLIIKSIFFSIIFTFIIYKLKISMEVNNIIRKVIQFRF